MNTTISRTVLALLSTLTLTAGRISAQTVQPSSSDPTSSRSAKAEDEPVVLNPFQVTTSQDKGYRATNSTSGTRLDTPIKELPLNLEVITNQFIRDTGATDLRQALRYSAGVILSSQSDAFVEPDSDPQSAGVNDPRGATRAPGDSTVKLRGFVIDQVLRDGFRRQYSADAVNIDRVELLRGPSALLYGVGSFGGVVNYLPKRPLLTERYSTSVSAGSHGFYRGDFDFTGPMGDSSWKPAYRITGAYEESGDPTDFYNSKHWTIAPVFSFRPFKNTSVVIDNEFGQVHQQGVGFQNIRSNVNAGSSRTAGWLTDVTQGRVNLRTFRWSGPDTYLKGPFRNNVIDVTQKVTDDLFFRAGAAFSRRQFDSRQIRDTASVTDPFSHTSPGSFLADATLNIGGTNYNLRNALTQANQDGKFPNSDAGFTPLQIFQNRPAGSFRGDQLYGTIANSGTDSQFLMDNGLPPGPPASGNNQVIRYDWIDDNKVEKRSQVRADGNYKLDLGVWGKHNFVVGLQYQKLNGTEEQFGPGYSYANHVVLDVDRYSYHNPGDFSYFRYGTQGDGRPDAARLKLYHWQSYTWDLGFYGVYQGRFFNDRLTLIGGARRDRNDQRSTQYFDYEAGRDPTLNNRVGEKAPTANSPQIGLSFAINRNLTVFGLYSTGVIPNYTALDGNGNAFAPTKAKNKEAGLKFDLFNGRISGTVSAYKIERTNTPKFLWWAPAPYKNAQNGFDPAQHVTTVWHDPNPEAVWYAIQKVGLAAAKKVYPSGFWPTLDAMATIPAGANQYTPGAGWTDIPGVARWWDSNVDSSGQRGLNRQASANTAAGSTANNIYEPLIDLNDPDINAFIIAAKQNYHGWGGNFYYTRGQTYYTSNGTPGTGNAPDGGGASVAINDEAKGWDVALIASITDDLQATFNFAHVKRRITSPTYPFVAAPYYPVANWYVRDGNFGTLSYNRDAVDAYGDLTDTTTYKAPIPEFAQAADDSPANTASAWIRYSLDHTVPALKGITLGLGGRWEDRRLWFTGFTGGGGNISRVTLPGETEPTLVQLWTKRQLTLSGLVEYRMVLKEKYHVRYALNVENLLDNQKRYGQVFAPGRSLRFTVGMDF